MTLRRFELSLQPSKSRITWASTADDKEAFMYARVATFQGDPARADEAIAAVRSELESEEPPEGLKNAKLMMLINRETGKGIGLTLYETEAEMRRGHETLNAMTPDGGGQRTSVEFYEVPIETIS